MPRPRTERLLDQDPEILDRLTALKNELDSGATPQRAALRGSIDDLIDFFYG